VAITGGSGGQWTELAGFPVGGNATATGLTIWQKVAATGDSAATFTCAYTQAAQKAVQWVIRVSDTGGTPTVGASSGKHNGSAATSLTSNQITIATGSQVLAVFTGRDASTAVTYTAGAWSGTATGLTGTERDDQSNTGSSQVSAELQDGAAAATGAGTVTAAATSSASQDYCAGIVELVPVGTATITYGTVSLINSGAPTGTVVAPTCNAGDLLLIVVGYGGGSPVLTPYPSPPAPLIAPGRTWQRQFHHRQTLPPPPPAAAVTAAAVTAPLMRPVITSRLPARARTGPAGLPGSGIASQVVTPLGSPPPTRPPQPVTPHVPGRAVVGPAGGCADGIASAVVTPLGSMPSPMPRPLFPRRDPQRAALGPAGLPGDGIPSAVVTPLGTPGPGWRAQPRRPGPRRAVWHGNAGAQPVPAVPPVPRPPGQARSRPPRRAIWRGFASTVVTPLGTPARRPGPQITSRPRSRAVWRGGAGTAPAGVTAPPRCRPLPPRRGPQRATVRRGAGLVNAAPPLFQVARSDSTVTDPRDGTATVTATAVTSSPTVADPRDGTATVTGPVTSTPSVADPRDGSATVS
jgi:hypothetical protein